MVIVSGTFVIDQEKHAMAIAAMNDMVAATEQEDGCIVYRFYEDVGAPGHFRVYEEWESAEHLAAHGETAHMAEFRKIIPQVLTEAPDVKRYSASALS